MGAASLSGIGLLNDKEGNDSYQVGPSASNLLGIGTSEKNLYSLGFFLDENGVDQYSFSHQFQNTLKKPSKYSLRLDTEEKLGIFEYRSLHIPKADPPPPEYHEPQLPEITDPDAIEKIYRVLTDPAAKQAIKEKAHQMFLKLDDKAVTFLIDSITADAFVRSRYFSKQYLPAFERKALPIVLNKIKESKEDDQKAKYLRSLVFFKSKAILLDFISQNISKKNGPLTTAAYISNLTTLNYRDSDHFYLRSLEHENEIVIYESIKAVQKFHLKEAIPQLTRLLGHDFYQIRELSSQTLYQLGDAAIKHLQHVYPDCSPLQKGHIDQIFQEYRQKVI